MHKKESTLKGTSSFLFRVDVVHAYKGVLKEKEALETTLKALSVRHEGTDGTVEGEGEGEGVQSDEGSNEKAAEGGETKQQEVGE